LESDGAIASLDGARVYFEDERRITIVLDTRLPRVLVRR
jgi:hypothetical protein